MGIVCIVIGIICIALGVQATRNWYKEAAAGGVSNKTSMMMLGGFFLGTIFLLGSLAFYV